MGKAMIIGCGGVASVAIHKCCQNSEVFTELCLASRTKAKCDALRDKLAPTTATKISTAQVDANNVAELTRLLEQERPEIVMVHRRADKAGRGAESGPALPGFVDYGGLPGRPRALRGHRQL